MFLSLSLSFACMSIAQRLASPGKGLHLSEWRKEMVRTTGLHHVSVHVYLDKDPCFSDTFHWPDMTGRQRHETEMNKQRCSTL